VVNTTGNAPPGLPAKVLDALGRLARGQRAHRQAVATQHNVTPLQLELLATLAAAPPPDPLVGHLARELAVTQPTITDSLRALDAKGLIARDADPADRRRTTVALTPAGTAIADQLAAADHRLLDAVTSLDPHQQEQVLTSLLDLIAALVDADVIDVARTCTTCHHHQLLPERHPPLHPPRHRPPPAELRVNCPDHAAAGNPMTSVSVRRLFGRLCWGIDEQEALEVVPDPGALHSGSSSDS
jgi:DNA-binding MarR family transcriptional regulator